MGAINANQNPMDSDIANIAARDIANGADDDTIKASMKEYKKQYFEAGGGFEKLMKDQGVTDPAVQRHLKEGLQKSMETLS
ncbi:MAG: hypothetical protein HC932_02255 [Thermales bacterium]|nr:hypothetical protein [Thermales bacterium]